MVWLDESEDVEIGYKWGGFGGEVLGERGD